MNGKCDVYAYEDSEGFTIHLAGRKRTHIDNAPPCPMEAFRASNTSEDAIQEYLKRQEKWKEWAESPEGSLYEDLKIKHAGESFHEDNLEDFKNRLLYLRELGYTFPDYVLELIDEEIKDEQA
jgi:hypothetical protein